MGDRRNYQSDRGERQMERILAELAGGDKTAPEMSARLHMTKSNLHIYLRRLQEEPRRVRVSGYQRTGGNPLRVYGLGSEPDAPLVRAKKLRKKPRKPHDMAVPCKAILDALKGMPQTAHELAETLKASVSYVRKYLKLLRAGRKVYVSRWAHPDGRGGLAQVFAVGFRKDAPYPEYDRRAYEQRVKADPAKREHRLTKRRVQQMLRKSKRAPVGWAAALGL